MDESAVKNQVFVTWMVWAGMLLSLFVYLGVMIYLIEVGDAPEPSETIGTMATIFVGLSVVEVIAVFVLRPILFFRRYNDDDFEGVGQLVGSHFVMCIVTWGLVEAVAIYGFVLSIMTYELSYYLAFMVPALILMLFFRPRLSALIEEYEARNPGLSEGKKEPDEPGGGAMW